MNESAPQVPPECEGKDPRGCWNVRCQLGKVCCRRAAPQAAPSVAGWKLVPLEPTQAMIDAFHGEDGDSACNKWDAMLAATPSCPSCPSCPSVAAPDAWQLKTSKGWIALEAEYVEYYRQQGRKVRPLYAVLPLPAVVQAEPATQALLTIAEWPCPEQDDMQSHNMREVARAALRHSAAPHSTQPAAPQLDTQRATEGMPAPVWQDIATAPKDDRLDPIIIGFAPDEEGYSPRTREGFWHPLLSRWMLWSDPTWKSSPQPTHWMPLPAPPAKKEGA